LCVLRIVLTGGVWGAVDGPTPPTPKARAGRAWSGVFIALAVFAGLAWAILKTESLSIVPPHIRALTVRKIGETLMTGYVWPLQCVGLLLTAALIGALVLVM